MTAAVRGWTRAIAITVALALVGCGRAPAAAPPGPPPQRAFYYWRTTLRLSPAERQALAALHVTRLYLRMFDLDWRDGAVEVAGPVALAEGEAVPAGLEVVPTVYLVNEVVARLDAPGVDALAARLLAEVDARARRLGVTWRELQLDCDWTDRTRGRYFALLEAVKARLPAGAILSATIRLHQIKYRERTGVPPVARGMLMFYNMGRFSADPEARAIFDEASARRYLARLASYPLPLDGALPIWSWTLHLRDEVVVGLMQRTGPDELAGLDFTAPAGPGRYRVTRSTFVAGRFVRAGDVLKVEVTGPDETRAAAALLARHLAPARDGRTIALFDLSERNLQRHATTDLERVFQTVR